MTDHPSALVSVPPKALEAIAFNLCSLHDFDPAFVQQNERFAMAAITEYLRATPAPAAPQAAGVGEIGWLVESDDNGPLYHTASRTTRNAAEALRFSRRHDAEAFIAAYGPNHLNSVLTPAWRAVEHRWG